MMALFATQTSSSRRSFSVGTFERDGPDFQSQVATRPIEDYVPCYPMKKCRSHTSIAQADSPLGVDEDGFVVTSAPENVTCVIGTEDDGDCWPRSSLANTACCCQPVTHVQLHHSTTSSTVMSSLSGACSPPQPAGNATSKPGCKSGCYRTSALGQTCAQASAAPPAAAARRSGADTSSMEGCASDLMGAFSILTSDQWSALHSAVTDGEPAGRAYKGGSCSAAGQATAPHAGTALQGHPVKCNSLAQGQQRAQGPHAPMPQPSAAFGSVSCCPGSDPSGHRASGARGSSGGDDGAGCGDQASRGGSTGSLVSLWAAVNSAMGSGVYDSTDDNILAGQRPGSGMRMPLPSATRAPVVPRTTIRDSGEHQHQPLAGSDGGLYRSGNELGDGGRAIRPTQNAGQSEAADDVAAARNCSAAGYVDSPDADSPTAEVAARSASCFAGSHFAQARSHMLQYGYFSHDPGQSEDSLTQATEVPSRAHIRNSIDVEYYYNPPRSSYHPLQGQIQEHEQQATRQASAPLPPALPLPQPAQQQPDQHQHAHNHTSSHPHSHSHQYQPQPQQSQQQQQQAPPVDSPSRRRGSTLGLQSGQTSYTTYGYRRAQSSLAALEQGHPQCCSQDGSSSDDDDTEEATRRAFRAHPGMARCSGWGLLGADTAPTTPTADVAGRMDPWATVLGHGPSNLGAARGDGVNGGSGGVQDGEGADDADGLQGPLSRKRSGYHLTNSHAAVELFLRLNHARQTMDFVKRQTLLFAGLDKAELSVWEALHLVNELREYEAVLMAEGGDGQDVATLSLLDHAFQTAELCRLHHPDLDWLHLVGLIHGLGKLLAHRKFGSQPQWAICGETYPLGCRFSSYILGSQYFTANPDRRRRLYNTPTGLYGPGCGLLNVVMSWSAPEYLYLVLMLNKVSLPQDAVWVLRHAKLLTLTRPHSCYLPLCSPDDLRRLPLLRSFQQLAAFRRVELPEGFALQGEQRTAYYSGLISKYLGEGRLRW